MRMPISSIILAVAPTLLFAACASNPGPGEAAMQDDAAELWTRTCSHCHNLRSAPEFTADQWSVIVTHMRTMGDLTRSEAEAVTAYLRSMREP